MAAAPARGLLGDFGSTPIKVLLGDFLGTAGTIRVANGVATPGVLVEVFSPTLIAPLFFTEVTGRTSFNVLAGVAHSAIPYVSEWARPLSAAEQAAAQALGADPQSHAVVDRHHRYPVFEIDLPPAARLPQAKPGRQVTNFTAIDLAPRNHP